ncbi:MAG: hypothetical protein E4H45_03285 [Nitrospirales bacterium]|nr:MAG: hypothetical protein E4H45_03285 [Nitrospirales bacterium]
MLTLATIDVGSNTIRLLIGAVEDERIADIHSARRITRLGNKVNQNGTLQDKNMEDSLAVLKEFSSAITHYRAHYTKAVGTSALREATNADLFIKKAFEETGILIEVISGEQEADLTLKGVLASLPMAGYSIPESALIVDMGGEHGMDFHKEKTCCQHITGPYDRNHSHGSYQTRAEICTGRSGIRI